jgi:hypothetical protein
MHRLRHHEHVYLSHFAAFVSRFTDITRQAREATQLSLDAIAKLADRTREELEDQLYQVQEQINTTKETLRVILEADREQIQSCLKSLQAAQRSWEKKAHIIIADNTAIGVNTRMIAGTDTIQPTFDLSVTQNRAENGAAMAAGVHSSEVLKTLLEQSSTPAPVVSLVQAMQMGNFDTRSRDVQALLQRSGTVQTDTNMAEPGRIEEEHTSASRIALDGNADGSAMAPFGRSHVG